MKTIVVLPAYNAEKTLEKTVRDIPREFVQEIILVDDSSSDKTSELAQKLGLIHKKHAKNSGYGANQKTCYHLALQRGADIIVMLHPDYQYDSSLIGELVRPILQGRFDYMFGSRVRTRKEALEGGMPAIKYLVNRIYSLIANLIMGVNFTEHMSGLRAYSARTLKKVPFQRFSNDFVFDQQFTVSAIVKGLKIAEIPIPVRYYEDSSSIQFLRGAKFMFGSFWILFLFILNKFNIYKSKIFK